MTEQEIRKKLEEIALNHPIVKAHLEASRENSGLGLTEILFGMVLDLHIESNHFKGIAIKALSTSTVPPQEFTWDLDSDDVAFYDNDGNGGYREWVDLDNNTLVELFGKYLGVRIDDDKVEVNVKASKGLNTIIIRRKEKL